MLEERVSVRVLVAFAFVCLINRCVAQDLDFWEPKSADELREVIRTTVARNSNESENDNALSKQLPPLPSNPLSGVTSFIKNGCQCVSGICSCCTGVFSLNGCMNLTYIPEDFAFDFRMLINNRVMYRNKIAGKNPKPVCINPPRLDFIEVCARFYDLHFIGRNMHVCLEMNGNFEGFELFSRQFNCLRMGDKGIKVLKPGEGSGLTRPPGLEAEIDAGTEDIDDYDEVLS
ncbi:uncharacterized protein LOC6054296 [Culex quinquefasciatus]|uniref:uncharacterized protein LOC6054296 n=1 Tax=Culex quinquefasciatus TaxID=7176 RepID=UPI0018E3D4FC|nr:uncharacterized protein LOC6054296 [Culex quinquefasciatus]